MAINFNAAHIGWPTSDSLLVALPQLAPQLLQRFVAVGARSPHSAHTFIGGPLRLRLAYIDVPCAEPRSARMLGGAIADRSGSAACVTSAVSTVASARGGDSSEGAAASAAELDGARPWSVSPSVSSGASSSRTLTGAAFAGETDPSAPAHKRACGRSAASGSDAMVGVEAPSKLLELDEADEAMARNRQGVGVNLELVEDFEELSDLVLPTAYLGTVF